MKKTALFLTIMMCLLCTACGADNSNIKSDTEEVAKADSLVEESEKEIEDDFSRIELTDFCFISLPKGWSEKISSSIVEESHFDMELSEGVTVPADNYMIEIVCKDDNQHLAFVVIQTTNGEMEDFGLARYVGNISNGEKEYRFVSVYWGKEDYTSEDWDIVCEFDSLISDAVIVGDGYYLDYVIDGNYSGINKDMIENNNPSSAEGEVDDIPNVSGQIQILCKKYNDVDPSYRSSYGNPFDLYQWNKVEGIKYYNDSWDSCWATDSENNFVAYLSTSNSYQTVASLLSADIEWPEPKTIVIGSDSYYVWHMANGYMIVQGDAFNTDYRKSYYYRVEYLSDRNMSKLLDGSSYVQNAQDSENKKEAERKANEGKIAEDNLLNEAHNYFYDHQEEYADVYLTGDDMVDVYSGLNTRVSSTDGDVVKIVLEIENFKWSESMYLDTISIDRTTGKGTNDKGQEVDWSYLK